MVEAGESISVVPVSKDLRRAQCGRPRDQASIEGEGWGGRRDSVAWNHKINTPAEKDEGKEEEGEEEE